MSRTPREFPVRRLYASAGALYLADQLVLFLVPLLLYSRTGSVGVSGAVYALEWAVRIGAGLLAKPATERLGAPRLLFWAEAARSALALGLLLQLTWLAFSPVGVAALGCAFALLNSLATVALTSYLAQAVPEKDYARVDAQVGSLDQLSLILGPALAGVLWEWLSPVLVTGVCAALLIAASAGFRSLPAPGRGPAETSTSRPPTFSRSLAIALGDPGLRACLVSAFFVNGLIGLAEAAGPFVLTGRFGASAIWFGAMNASAGLLGVALLSRAAGWIARFGDLRVWAGAQALALLGALVLGLAERPSTWLAGFALLIAGALVSGVGYRTYRARAVGSAELPGVVSVMWSVGQLGSVAFSAAMAALHAAFPPQATLLAIAAAYALWWLAGAIPRSLLVRDAA